MHHPFPLHISPSYIDGLQKQLKKGEEEQEQWLYKIDKMRRAEQLIPMNRFPCEDHELIKELTVAGKIDGQRTDRQRIVGDSPPTKVAALKKNYQKKNYFFDTGRVSKEFDTGDTGRVSRLKFEV